MSSVEHTAARGRGKVSLVGAGPGDPELLTLRAARRLAEADLVLYDALVDPRVLALVAPTARRFPVGKRAGRPSVSQSTIEALLVRYARRGLHVVRLKCGDPFVFGRGGEEALAVARAGLPVEVVPGVSSAVAAPAFANVPVTHRGLASGFVVLTGEPDDAWRRTLAALEPASLTVVLLMSLRARGEVARAALARGWSAETPVAVVLGAHGPDGTSLRTTLGELADLALPAEARGLPGTLVVGAVVGVADALAALRDGTPDATAPGAGRPVRVRPDSHPDFRPDVTVCPEVAREA